MSSFVGKVVVVTGGANGIGRAICMRFAQEGAIVFVLDINADEAKQTAQEITIAGGIARALVVDITQYSQVNKAISNLCSEFRGIDVLINNAGWDFFKPFVDTQPVDWSQIININLMGALNILHAALPNMMSRGGRVISVSSDAARVGSSGESIYAACKSALFGLSKSLAREHARHGITFNVVCPGPTQTNLLEEVVKGSTNPNKLKEAFKKSIPMNRLGSTDDLPGIFIFLASEEASFITGQVISVSGGLTMNG